MHQSSSNSCLNENISKTEIKGDIYGGISNPSFEKTFKNDLDNNANIARSSDSSSNSVYLIKSASNNSSSFGIDSDSESNTSLELKSKELDLVGNMKSDSDKPYVINLINSIIGVAILAIASSFRDTGVILTIITLIFGAVLTSFSISILVRCAKQTNTNSYEYLCYSVLGKTGKTIVEICLSGFMLGVMVGYYIALGDLLPPIIYGSLNITPIQRTTVLLLVGIFLVQPLVLLKDISSITRASSISLCGYAITATVIIMKFLTSGKVFQVFQYNNHNINYWNSSYFFSTMSLFALGYACHPQIFIVYIDLKENANKVQSTRMDRIVNKAIAYVSILYTTIGSCGYLNFKANTNGNLLTNFKTSPITQIMRLSFCCSCIISFPLIIFPVRQSIFTLVKNFLPGSNYVALNDNYSKTQQNKDETYINPTSFYCLSVILNLITMTTAIVTPDIATMLKLTGCTMGSMIAFILPALIALQCKSDSKNSPKTRLTEFDLESFSQDENFLDKSSENTENDHSNQDQMTNNFIIKAKVILTIGILIFFITPITIWNDLAKAKLDKMESILEMSKIGVQV